MAAGGRENGSSSSHNGAVFKQGAVFLIGVAGGTASGKSTVCQKIIEKLGEEHKRQVGMLTQDSFYRPLTPEEQAKAAQGKYNFDHPAAFNHTLMADSLKKLKQNSVITVPKYSHKDHAMVTDEEISVSPADVILVEGILIFYAPEVRDLFNIKIFVDTDADTRLAKRVNRDTKELGRSLEQVIDNYENLVKPAYEEFCVPTKKYADVIVPRGAENERAIDLIVQHIQGLLRSPRPSPSGNDSNTSSPEKAKIGSSGSLRPH